jgi:2,3,4,5-tetrahydropyridine-2-carboxylate N-succinyltransferase
VSLLKVGVQEDAVNHEKLREEIERLSALADPPAGETRAAVARLLGELEQGRVRAADPLDGRWAVNGWVKRGILLGFRHGTDVESGLAPIFRFRDRDTFPPLDAPLADRKVRIVPGGTTVRRGAHLGEGVVVMPPAYINVGAWVGPRSMIDSHALVGSCAQVGARVHLSAAAQIGGVLEPIGALPVVIEDDVFVGGGCGVYEGTQVRRRSVLAPGVVLSRSVPLYDLVRGEIRRSTENDPLEVPEGAVVVPGSRKAGGDWARSEGVQLYAPVVVKYRDSRTDAASALEDALR